MRPFFLGLRARVLMVLCLSFWISATSAQCVGCNPASRHSVDSCGIPSPVPGGGTLWYQRGSDGDGGLSVGALLGQACSNYAQAHSDANFIRSFTKCTPLLPDPNLNSYGGTFGSYGVEGTLQTYSVLDQTTTSVTSSWNMATCSCNDTLRSDRVGLGNDGSCYCKDGRSWDDTRRACVTIEERNETNQPQACPKVVVTGNPIYPLTGAKKEFVRTGLTLGGLELVLTYDSSGKLPSGQAIPASELTELNAFGPLWKSSLHHRLQVSLNRKTALLTRGNGEVLSFSGNGAGTFSPTSDHANKLLSITGGYRFIDAATGDQETFDTAGKPVTLHTAAGKLITFWYAGSNLIRVQADDGRAIRLAYTNSLISTIRDADGSVLTPVYDTHGNLASLTWQDGKARQFLYENAALPWALTGQVDENGSRISTYAYDEQGRAISTEQAGGLQKYSVTYASPPVRVVTETLDAAQAILYRVHGWQIPTGIAITQPNGAVVNVDAVKAAGMPSVAARSQPAGSGCDAATGGLSYDANGNIASQDDFQGTRTCFAYDASHREVLRVEGLDTTVACASVTPVGATLPAGARKVFTEWHPHWRLPTKLTQPLKDTTVVYHGQGESCSTAAALPNGEPRPFVCRQTEQAKLANGAPDQAPQVTSSTYDSAGRVLTTTDGVNTTTFSYYSDTAFDGGPYDADLDKVVLLLHGDAAGGSSAITDASLFARPLSVIGNTALASSVTLPGFGEAIAFDGNPGYLSIGASADFDFGAGDFTIETFLYKNANNPNASRIWNPNGDVYDGVNLSIDPSGNLAVYVSTSGTAWTYSLPVVANLANGQWHHLAVTRSGGAIYAFVNGARFTVTTALGATPLYASGGSHVIGGQAGVNRALNGYIDEFRITKGKARYTQAFTPPTAPFSHQFAGPTDVGHTVGDLQSVTDAAGNTSQFTQYDRLGRVRQIVNAAGETTDISYTPRGWIGSVTVTANDAATQITSYIYDFAGQLTQVSLPDGTSLTYSYDAAHRLTGITDGAGNSVTHTLDNVGNRIGENMNDAAGNLQHSIGRAFDALNRVQQSIGASM